MDLYITGVSLVSWMKSTSISIVVIYHAMYSALVSVIWLQFHVATLKLPSLFVWNSTSSEALQVLVMAELNVM